MRRDGRISYLRVRRLKVLECLSYLQRHNPFYADIVIDTESLNSLPLDDVLPNVPHVTPDDDHQEFDSTVPTNAHNVDLCNRFQEVIQGETVLEVDKAGLRRIHYRHNDPLVI